MASYFTVSYSIFSSIDGHAEPVSSGQVCVVAPDAEAARAGAVDWVWSHDPRCDDRIDPSVRVSSVTLEEEDDLDPSRREDLAAIASSRPDVTIVG